MVPLFVIKCFNPLPDGEEEGDDRQNFSKSYFDSSVEELLFGQ